MSRIKRASELAALLKPYVIQWINDVSGAGATTLSAVDSGSSTSYAPTPHDLNSVHHSGTLPHNSTKMSGLSDDTHDLYANADGYGVRSAYMAERLNKTITASTGLSGGGLMTLDRYLSINFADSGSDSVYQGATGCPGAASYAARTDHRHEVISTASPGIAACLLSTNSGGELNIRGDFLVGISASPTLFVDISEGNVYIEPQALPPTVRGALTVRPPTATAKGLVLQSYESQTAAIAQILDNSGNDLLLITNQGDLESGNPNFVSGLTGWQITHDGNAEFWNAVIRGELHASVFVADEMHATGGTLAVLNATTIASPNVATDNKIITTGSFIVVTKASWQTGLSYMSGCDVWRGKYMSEPVSGSPLDIFDIYLEVVGAASSNGDRDLTDGNPGTYDVPVYLRSGSPSSASTVIPTGTTFVKWGEVNQASGTYTGGIIITSDLSQSPYMDIFTIDSDSSPWAAAAIKPRTRIGNLDGVLGLSEQWGIATGKSLADTSCPYVVVSDQQVGLFGVTQSWWDSGGNVIGQVNPNGTGSASPVFWFGPSENDKKLEYRENGELIIRGNMIVGPTLGYVADTVQIYCPFDGTPSENDYTVNFNSKLGQSYTKTGGFSGRFGAIGGFGKVLAIGGSTTNLIKDPDMFSTSGWSACTDGTCSISIFPVSYHSVSGSTSMQIRSCSAATCTVFVSDAVTIASNASVFLQGWQRAALNASTNIRLRDMTNNSDRIYLSSSQYDQWEYVSGSWYNSTGASVSVKAMLTNTASVYGVYTYFDAIQLETGYEATPYAHGGMASGYAWTGTANQSTTTKEPSYLGFSGSQIGAWNDITISAWVRLVHPRAFTTRVIASRYLTSSNYAYLAILTDGRVRTAVNSVGTGTTVTSTCTVDDTNWHHYATTIQGLTVGSPIVKTYLDGALVASATGTACPMSFYAASLAIGHYSGTGSNYLNGYLDDLLIATRVYTDDEINGIYTSEAPLTFHPGNFETMWTGYDGANVHANSTGLFGESSDGTKSFALNNASSACWGGFTIDPGDMVLGDNKADSAAVFWDKSAGTFGFYGDGVAEPPVYISTCGNIIFGSGSIKMNASGIAFYDTSTAVVNALKWYTWSSSAYSFLGRVMGDYGGGASAVVWVSGRRPSGAPWSIASITLSAVDDVRSTSPRFVLSSDDTISVLGASIMSFNSLKSLSSASYTKLMFGRTTNGQMTYGLHLNQGGADNEIFAVESSDISHSFTGEVESMVYLDILKQSATAGGAAIRGFSETDVGLHLRGGGNSDDTSKATTSVGFVVITANKPSSGSFTAIGTQGNIIAFREGTTTRALIDKEGDLHLDASSNASAFDTYNDIQLLTGLRASLMPDGDVLKERFKDWIEEARPVLETAGIVTYNDDGHHFVALKKLHMLEIDAMRQLYERIVKLESKIDSHKFDDTS